MNKINGDVNSVNSALEQRLKAQAIMRILVVDDEEDIGVLMRIMLHSAGHEVIYAQNLSAAKYLLQSNTVDAVFLDLNLEDEYGLELIPEIRQTNRAAEIIIISAQKRTEVSRDLEKAEVKYMIEKPFNKNEIMRVLQDA